jgi:hypothetical protein
MARIVRSAAVSIMIDFALIASTSKIEKNLCRLHHPARSRPAACGSQQIFNRVTVPATMPVLDVNFCFQDRHAGPVAVEFRLADPDVLCSLSRNTCSALALLRITPPRRGRIGKKGMEMPRQISILSLNTEEP